MNAAVKGFREIEHTADWELEVWGPSLPDLFEQAARGMYQLCGAKIDFTTRCEQALSLRAEDPESLLVLFLSELLFLGETDGTAFDGFELSEESGSLNAHLTGGRLVSLEKEIKAVTYHSLQIEHTCQGFRVRIVFDV